MKQSTTADKLRKDYVKAYMKLLTQVAQVPRRSIKVVDEYFFGTIEERDEDSESVRPYFYGSMSFGLAVLLFCYVAIGA